MSTALHSGPGDGVSFERELLYKVLFDLRADVNDLKRMLTELMQRAERPAEPTKDLAGLLPASATVSLLRTIRRARRWSMNSLRGN